MVHLYLYPYRLLFSLDICSSVPIQILHILHQYRHPMIFLSHRFSSPTLHAGHSPSPIQGYTRTFSFLLIPSTCSPNPSTIPAISCPGVRGYFTPLSVVFNG